MPESSPTPRRCVTRRGVGNSDTREKWKGVSMRLSEEKNFTNEFDFRVLALLQTLRCYGDTFTYPKKIDDFLHNFITFLDKEVYHDLPTKRDVELIDEKYFVTTFYKEEI